MRIVIVGGGIGGLSAYLALRKHMSPLDPNLRMIVLESHLSPHSQTQASGGGLGLAPNGQRSIASITTDAVPRLRSRAFPGTAMTFMNDKGGILGVMKVGRGERYGYDMLMITRAEVHDALLQEIANQSAVKWGVKVTGVREVEGGVLVELADGTTEEADLVIGADGVRSVVKDCLLNGEYPAQYDGLTGVGGFLASSSIPSALKESLGNDPVTMVFGRLGFFAYALASPATDPDPLFMWWSIYETPVLPDRNNIDYEDIREQLLRRCGDWKSPSDTDGQRIYRHLIEIGCLPPSIAPLIPNDSSGPSNDDPISTAPLILPRYVTPRLPSWSNATHSSTSPKNRGRVLLIGDAAHTMPPDVGQGASCAVEDAVVYALLLKHYTTAAVSESPAKPAVSTQIQTSVLEKAALAYEAIRKPHIHKLLDVAKRSGDAKKELGWFGQIFRDLIMKLICKLPESLNDAVFGYDPEAEVRKYLAKEGD